MTYESPVHSEAPWTEEEVENLNAFQSSGYFHAFMCARRGDSPHTSERGDRGQLVATPQGWVCPDCDYTQAWAHAWMADGSWRDWGTPELERDAETADDEDEA